MQKSDEVSSLKDSLTVKYISHFKGQIRNSIFVDPNPLKENRLIYPSANTIAFNTLSISFEN
jgi:hypothetical protein